MTCTSLCRDAQTNVHIAVFVAGVTIVSTILWDAFETLVLPRTPMRTLRRMATRVCVHRTRKALYIG
jgi:hypothetical protein